jgi:hypothetical protein
MTTEKTSNLMAAKSGDNNFNNKHQGYSRYVVASLQHVEFVSIVIFCLGS